MHYLSPRAQKRAIPPFTPRSYTPHISHTHLCQNSEHQARETYLHPILSSSLEPYLYSPSMPDTKDRTPSHEYAGPAFYSSPPASSLPVPKFEERSPAVAGVGTHPDHGEPKPPPDAITHINGASSDPKPCSPSRKSVPFTPDARSVPFTPGAKSHDGRTVSSTNNEQGEIVSRAIRASTRCE